MSRRTTKRDERAAGRKIRFEREIARARTGREAAKAGWDWVRAEMAVLAKVDPAGADKAWRELADSLAQIAAETVQRVKEVTE